MPEGAVGTGISVVVDGVKRTRVGVEVRGDRTTSGTVTVVRCGREDDDGGGEDGGAVDDGGVVTVEAEDVVSRSKIEGYTSERTGHSRVPRHHSLNSTLLSSPGTLVV